jgi:UDP:flavonoid glycosyltransferase YjiC (YdhE family)
VDTISKQSKGKDRMKVLIASTPLTGHLNPLLAIAHTLVNEGHEVVGLSANIMRDRIERVGAGFRAFPAGGDLDLSQLVAPTLAALADEPDVLVVVTTGGRSLDVIPGQVPCNARLATYLPFEWLLPNVDVLVTNGGYGSVNQALSFGVPLVTAGLTEDKADVNARVAWSGVGINLATNNSTPQALRQAVHAVLENPIYRSRAASMAAEYSGIDTRYEIIRILGQVSGVPSVLRGAPLLP